MEIINHPSHPHPLNLTTLDREGWWCKICRKELSGVIYSCQRCHYMICRACAKLPQKMRHPFHPHHSIVLLKKDSPVGCSACGLTTGSGYLYDCEQCRFCLDLRCAALMPTHKYKESRKPEVRHQHSLIVCDQPKDDTHYYCGRCYEPFEEDDLVYACLECICLLDEKCAGLPTEIKHPFHLEHPLTFLPGLRENASSKCSACGGFLFPKSAAYHCSLCNFIIDFHCSTLMPTSEISDPDQVQIQIQPATHPHFLIQCSSSLKNFYHECYGCGLPFTDSIFICLQCGILLHKSCADLPRKIKHPFHLQHSLILYENSADDRLYSSFDCRGCHSGHGDFVYVCQECDFLLDIRCAARKFLFVKSNIHKHSLALFDFEIREFPCDICYRRCYNYLFRCVECNFNIHDHCHPSLPKTIKHDCHCDLLIFTTAKIKDYPDENENAEFYCYACEERRNLADPTYYCEECHFVAHVHCVFSEILHHLQTESMALAGEAKNIKLETPVDTEEHESAPEEGNFSATETEEEKNTKAELVRQLSEGIANLKTNIDAMTEKINELMQRRNQHIATLREKLTEKTYRTGRQQPASWGREPVSVGFETAKVTVSHI